MDIEIDIKDERHYTDIALIIDRDDFGIEINRLRSVFDTNLKKDILPQEVEEQNKYIDSEVEISRKSLCLPIVFRKVIEAVVFRSKVTNDDYSPAYLDSTWDTFNDEYNTPDETYFIVLSPSVRDKDVLQVLQQYRDRLGNEKLASKYQMIQKIWDISSGMPSIKNHRKWYFQNLAGMTFEKISQQEQDSCTATTHRNKDNRVKNCTCYDVSTIRKAIKTYDQLLGKVRTL